MSETKPQLDLVTKVFSPSQRFDTQLVFAFSSGFVITNGFAVAFSPTTLGFTGVYPFTQLLTLLKRSTALTFSQTDNELTVTTKSTQVRLARVTQPPPLFDYVQFRDCARVPVEAIKHCLTYLQASAVAPWGAGVTVDVDGSVRATDGYGATLVRTDCIGSSYTLSRDAAALLVKCGKTLSGMVMHGNVAYFLFTTGEWLALPTWGTPSRETATMLVQPRTSTLNCARLLATFSELTDLITDDSQFVTVDRNTITCQNIVVASEQSLTDIPFSLSARLLRRLVLNAEELWLTQDNRIIVALAGQTWSLSQVVLSK